MCYIVYSAALFCDIVNKEEEEILPGRDRTSKLTNSVFFSFRRQYLPMYRGMEENGSEGIDELIKTEAAEGKFLYDVDFFCISVRVADATDGWICLMDG